MPRSLLSWVMWTLEASGCLSRTSLSSTTWPGTSRVAPFPTWVQPQRVGCTSEPVGRWRDQTGLPWQGVDTGPPLLGPAGGILPTGQVTRQSFLGSLMGHPGVLSRPSEQVRAPGGGSDGTQGQPTQHSLEYQHLLAVPGCTHSYSWTLPSLPPAQTTTTTSVLPFPTL